MSCKVFRYRLYRHRHWISRQIFFFGALLVLGNTLPLLASRYWPSARTLTSSINSVIIMIAFTTAMVILVRLAVYTWRRHASDKKSPL